MRVNVSCSLSSDFDIADSQCLLTPWMSDCHVKASFNVRPKRAVCERLVWYRPGRLCISARITALGAMRRILRLLDTRAFILGLRRWLGYNSSSIRTVEGTIAVMNLPSQIPTSWVIHHYQSDFRSYRCLFCAIPSLRHPP